MSKYAISKEFSKYEHMKYPLIRPLFAVFNPIAKKARPKSDATIKIKQQIIKGYKQKEIELLIFEPKGLKDNVPCLVYFHAGAFLIQAAPYHYALAKEYAKRAKCKVVFVDYRLTTKYSFPVPIEDCFSAYKWVVEEAATLHIDRKKIAVGGDSAGGNLAAAVTLMVRDRLNIRPCFQMLIYPVIDRRMQTESMKKYTDTPMWNSKLSKKMWAMYLPNSSIEQIAYASPIEAASLSNLPNAYIETAEFDSLHDEGINYAKALQKAGNRVDLYETKGTMHGFDIVWNSNIVRECVTRRIEALQAAFAE